MASVILKIDVFNLSFQSGVGVSSLREGERSPVRLYLPAADQTRALSSGARGGQTQTDRRWCSLCPNCKESHISAQVCWVILHVWRLRRVRPRFWSHLKTYLKLPRSCNGIDRGVWSVKQQRTCYQNRDHRLVQVRANIAFYNITDVHNSARLKSGVSFFSWLSLCMFLFVGKLLVTINIHFEFGHLEDAIKPSVLKIYKAATEEFRKI